MNEQQQRVEKQEVRDLIADAGPRLDVPADEVATIRAAARGEWLQMVARERRRRALRLRGGLAIAASVVVALVLSWWWTTRTSPVAAPVIASVELLAGRVYGREPGGPAVELTVGSRLAAGASLETGGRSDGSPAGVALRLAGGQSLRLAADSSVRLLSERRFDLRRGSLYLDSDSSAGTGQVEVVTRLGAVRDVGTQFEVRLSGGALADAAMRVRVREGEVSLEAAGDSHRAVRGDQLSLGSDGSVVRTAVEPYGPEWSWVVDTAPSIEIEGLLLSAFLEWVARETGRGVRYADPAVAQAAESEIVLHGSIEGFSPAEALDSVVAGSGLRHQVENGTILISG